MLSNRIYEFYELKHKPILSVFINSVSVGGSETFDVQNAVEEV